MIQKITYVLKTFVYLLSDDSQNSIIRIPIQQANKSSTNFDKKKKFFF